MNETTFNVGEFASRVTTAVTSVLVVLQAFKLIAPEQTDAVQQALPGLVSLAVLGATLYDRWRFKQTVAAAQPVPVEVVKN